MNREQIEKTRAFLREMENELRASHSLEWNRWYTELLARLDTPEDRRAELARRLPRALQPLLTFLTGKAGDEQPLWKNTSTSAYLVNLAQMFAGPTLATLALQAIPGATLPFQIGLGGLAFVGTVATAGAVRAGTSTYLHHSTHYNFAESAFWNRLTAPLQRKFAGTPFAERWTGRKGWNRFLGELISALTLVAPFDLYQRDHRKHHSDALATWDDPDWLFLFHTGGFTPGQSVPSYRKRLWKTLLSPRFHLRFARGRLHDNFLNAQTGGQLESSRRSCTRTFASGQSPSSSSTWGSLLPIRSTTSLRCL